MTMGVPAVAQTVWPDLQLSRPVISNLRSPVDITHAGDGSGRLFVVERAGQIQVWENRTLSTFLDIRGRVNTSDNGGDERGLLGLAFPPGFASSGHFYVNYISGEAGRVGDTVISRFSVDPDDSNEALADSEQIILTVDQPEANHNGGQMHFGPDGYLYIGLGDGGGGGDNHGPIGNGQAVSALLGKMLRLDVEGPADPGKRYAIPPDNPFVGNARIPDEIWAFGLRNPWRWSFDRETWDMYIADVGQNTREEVNFTPAGSRGGENYQWRQLEGFFTFNAGTPLTEGISTEPIHDYGRSDGRSITGGYVYRGSTFPRMDGIYFFGDYQSGRIWGLQRDPDGNWVRREFLDTSHSISTFGEDEEGNLYLASLFLGAIYELQDTRDARYLQITDASFDEDGMARVSVGTEVGRRYQLQFSPDLLEWENLGSPATATRLRLTMSETLDEPPVRGFFRVAELED